MTLPSPKICRRIRGLFRLIGSPNANEAANARKKLDKALLENGLTWNDITACVVEADAADGAASQRSATPPTNPGDGPQINVLDLVLQIIEMHIAITPEERMFAALWTLHTHVFDRFDQTPFCGVTSPIHGCGKSRLLKLLAQLTANSFYSEDVTPAAVHYELVNGSRSCHLDEGDNLGLFNDPKMRRLLNSMWERGGNAVRHIDGRNRRIDTYSPVILACIGLMPWPLMSRCGAVINMQRPGKRVKLERFYANNPIFSAARSEIQKWAATCKLNHDPEMPLCLPPHSRVRDNCRVLFAIADDLGHGEAARAAMVALHGERLDEAPGVTLLINIRDIFDRLGVDRIASKHLIAELLALDESPWLDWRGLKDDRAPRKLNETELSGLLRPFDKAQLFPRTIRLTPNSTARGYLRKWFERAWDAYCPEPDTPTQPSKIIHLVHDKSDT
jgi:Protein of unknown function (DUF3631)